MAPFNSLCILTPGSRGVPGVAGSMDKKKPFGLYSGSFEKSRNWAYR